MAAADFDLGAMRQSSAAAAAATSPGGASASSSPDASAGLDSWLPAHTEDGTVYWYHRVTRAVRWERPSRRTAAKMEQRIRSEEEEVKARQHERLTKLAQEQAAAAAAEAKRAAVQTKVEARVHAWAKGRSMRSLLSTLQSVLQLCGRQVPAEVTAAGRSRSDADVKKGYLKALRLVHPDKMNSADVAAKVEAKTVFEVLQASWVEHTARANRSSRPSPSGGRRTASHSAYSRSGRRGTYGGRSAPHRPGAGSPGSGARNFSTGAGDGGGMYAAPGSWFAGARRNSAF